MMNAFAFVDRYISDDAAKLSVGLTGIHYILIHDSAKGPIIILFLCGIFEKKRRLAGI